MRCADMGSITEFHHQSNQIDHDSRKEMRRMMQGGVSDIADKKPEIKRARQNDKKPEYHFFKIHQITPLLLVFKQSYGQATGL